MLSTLLEYMFLIILLLYNCICSEIKVKIDDSLKDRDGPKSLKVIGLHQLASEYKTRELPSVGFDHGGKAWIAVVLKDKSTLVFEMGNPKSKTLHFPIPVKFCQHRAVFLSNFGTGEHALYKAYVDDFVTSTKCDKLPSTEPLFIKVTKIDAVYSDGSCVVSSAFEEKVTLVHANSEISNVTGGYVAFNSDKHAFIEHKRLQDMETREHNLLHQINTVLYTARVPHFDANYEYNTRPSFVIPFLMLVKDRVYLVNASEIYMVYHQEGIQCTHASYWDEQNILLCLQKITEDRLAANSRFVLLDVKSLITVEVGKIRQHPVFDKVFIEPNPILSEELVFIGKKSISCGLFVGMLKASGIGKNTRYLNFPVKDEIESLSATILINSFKLSQKPTELLLRLDSKGTPWVFDGKSLHRLDETSSVISFPLSSNFLVNFDQPKSLVFDQDTKLFYMGPTDELLQLISQQLDLKKAITESKHFLKIQLPQQIRDSEIALYYIDYVGKNAFLLLCDAECDYFCEIESENMDSCHLDVKEIPCEDNIPILVRDKGLIILHASEDNQHWNISKDGQILPNASTFFNISKVQRFRINNEGTIIIGRAEDSKTLYVYSEECEKRCWQVYLKHLILDVLFLDKHNCLVCFLFDDVMEEKSEDNPSKSVVLLGIVNVSSPNALPGPFIKVSIPETSGAIEAIQIVRKKDKIDKEHRNDSISFYNFALKIVGQEEGVYGELKICYKHK